MFKFLKDIKRFKTLVEADLTPYLTIMPVTPGRAASELFELALYVFSDGPRPEYIEDFGARVERDCERKWLAEYVATMRKQDNS